MSALIKTRIRPSSALRVTAPGPIRETGPSRDSPQFTPIGPHVEPLEASARDREAPESWHRSRAEAPDAEKGETHPLERQFTHGRSRG